MSIISRGETIFPCIEKGDTTAAANELCRALVADAQNGSLHAANRGNLWNRNVFDRACRDVTSDQGLLRVAPVTGRALLFRSTGPDGRQVDPTTWHAGCATHNGKEKHILTFFRSLGPSVLSEQSSTVYELLQNSDESIIRQELAEETTDGEDECEEGWVGPECRQCAPGYVGDFCTRAVESESTTSHENNCEVALEPTSVVTRSEDPQVTAVDTSNDAPEELHVFDGFLSTSEVEHLSALGKQLVQTKHGTVKGYMSRVELSKVAAAKKDVIYRAVRTFVDANVETIVTGC